MVDVLGLGTAAMDVVLSCSDLPREDGFALVGSEALVPGGSCANVMAALGVLGFSSGLACKLGDDRYGREFLEDLARRGIDSSLVKVKPGGVTLHTFITVAGNGAKAIFAHLGDSLLELGEEEVGPEALEGVRVFYTDLMPAGPALKLARECRKRKIKVVFDLEVPVDFHRLCGTGEDRIREMIGLADLFIAGGEALTRLTGRPDPARALEEICGRHPLPEGAAATLGPEGSLWLKEGELVSRPAMKVESRDTTGAGDAFAAGLMAGRFLENRPRPEALDLATACAALKCTQPGPRLRGDRAQVEELLKRAGRGLIEAQPR